MPPVVPSSVLDPTGRFISRARAHLPVVHYVLDGALWALALPLAVWLRYDYDTSRLGTELIRSVVLALILQGVIGLVLGQYRRKWRYGSFDEVRFIAVTAVAVGTIMTIGLWWDLTVPRSVPMLAAVFALFGQVTVRSTWRSYVEHSLRPSGADVERLVVAGAGDGGTQIVRTLLTNASSPFVPVAFVDDDPAKRNLRTSGVAVAGTIADLAKVASIHRATGVLVAIPSAAGSLIRRIDDLARRHGLDVYVVPPVEQLIGGLRPSDIRPVSHGDLLGRHPAEIDPVAIAGYITGRRVLVTGAGGSIGSELCRQILRFQPSQLLMLDRDESGLHGLQLSIEGRALLDSPDLLLADIRDADRIDALFAEHRPEIVFHAAALKHLPLLESHPAEGWKTNVVGTGNLLASARRHGVDRFVNVSSDKAANPTSVLGLTKRITERMTAHASTVGNTTCVSVRFGNVLGSSGSVLQAFEAQAAAGGPLTVTDRDVTRYFMTIEEASRLVVHAGAIGLPGEVMILDMGEPVKILDIANRIAESHQPPLDITFTGLRSNEKLHEDLVADGEQGERRSHAMIAHVDVEPLVVASSEPPRETIDEIRGVAMRRSPTPKAPVAPIVPATARSEVQPPRTPNTVRAAS